MATKKPAAKHLDALAKAAGIDLRGFSGLEKLSPEQQARVDLLLPEAKKIVEDIEDRMVALATVATQRWQPDANLHDADEDGPPVLDLDEFLETLDEISECAMVRSLAVFMGLPAAIVDVVVAEKLRSAYVPVTVPPKRNEQGFVVHRGRR